ncbi:hypothetical protein CEXT_653701 [Caerostris extrusa]|uniref:Uncharacterized protein n=1 Tax=Caerostris extrusa TaxID=172846 RepID=A0AAV4M4I8_CAEEX|nr:hypothetical protein CEXT_653701 [Caerostris extrusa]
MFERRKGPLPHVLFTLIGSLIELRRPGTRGFPAVMATFRILRLWSWPTVGTPFCLEEGGFDDPVATTSCSKVAKSAPHNNDTAVQSVSNFTISKHDGPELTRSRGQNDLSDFPIENHPCH